MQGLVLMEKCELEGRKRLDFPIISLLSDWFDKKHGYIIIFRTNTQEKWLILPFLKVLNFLICYNYCLKMLLPLSYSLYNQC